MQFKYFEGKINNYLRKVDYHFHNSVNYWVS